MAPPIPVNEEIKPTIMPKTVFKNKFNLIDLFSNERRNYSFIIRFFDEIKN